MSDNRLVFEGLDELKDALRRLPQELGSEAGSIIRHTTGRAEALIRNSYPERTGKLRRAVKSTVEQYAHGAVGTVYNTSKIATIFEHGTAARHYFEEGSGRRHDTGSARPGNVFIPIMQRERRRMYEQMRDLLRFHGLEVSG